MPRTSGTDASFRTVEPLPRKPAIRLTALLLAVLLLWGASPAAAQGGLYGPEAPRDVSYLRVINAGTGEVATPVVAGEEWEPLEFGEVSPYRQLPPGEHELSVAGLEIGLTTRPEGFTTVALLEGELVAITDTPLRDISRGLITLYNLTSDRTLSLGTADGAQVVAGVGPRSAGSRVVSQAEVELVVRENGERVASLGTRLYRRGEAHGIIVLPAGSEPQVVYAPAAAEL